MLKTKQKGRNGGTRTQMRRFQIYLPSPLHKQIILLAGRKGLSMADTVRRLVELGLEGNKKTNGNGVSPVT